MRFALGRDLFSRRKVLGWTQARLAQRPGSSPSRVAKMEATDPSVGLICSCDR
jgi:predicted transcriptional regulator